LDALDGLLRHPSTRDDLTGGWSVAAIGWADRGQLDRAEDAVAHARTEATRAGPNGEVALSWALAEIAWQQGSPEWCEEHARHGVDQAMLLNPAHANCAALMAWSQLELGRPVDGVMVYLPFPAAAGLTTEIAAVQALAAGDHARAAELFDEAQGRHEGYFRRSGLRCQWGIAEAQRRAGDLEGALATLKDLEETCARAGITFLDGHIEASARRCDPEDSRGRRPDGRRARALVTTRQRQVLSLVHGGLRTPEIASRLGLSPATVDTHIRGAMDRLGVSSRAEAARRVFEAD
jgi:DNA-binding CsgD family transcriptional regulator